MNVDAIEHKYDDEILALGRSKSLHALGRDATKTLAIDLYSYLSKKCKAL